MSGMGSLLPFQGEFTEPRLSRGGERLGHVAAPGPPGPGPNLGLQTAALLHRSMHGRCEPSFTTRVLQLLFLWKLRWGHHIITEWDLVITEKEMQCFSSLNTHPDNEEQWARILFSESSPYSAFFLRIRKMWDLVLPRWLTLIESLRKGNVHPSCLTVQFSSVTQSCPTLPPHESQARQASLSITNSRSLLKLMPIKSVMPFRHLILCCPLLLLPPIPPSIRVFSNESTLRMRWPKYWSFSFSISPSSEHPGLISFRMDWLDLLAVQGTLKSLHQHHSSKASILRHSAFFTVNSHIHTWPMEKP